MPKQPVRKYFSVKALRVNTLDQTKLIERGGAGIAATARLRPPLIENA